MSSALELIFHNYNTRRHVKASYCLIFKSGNILIPHKMSSSFKCLLRRFKLKADGCAVKLSGKV
jgi:hypothetical protein